MNDDAQYSKYIRAASEHSRAAAHALQAAHAQDDTTAIVGAVPRAIERVDALYERAARYRAATGRRFSVRVAGRGQSVFVRAALLARLRELAALRNEPTTRTLDLIIEAGILLLDERLKRYEAAVLADRATVYDAADTIRRIHPFSPTLPRAAKLVNPLEGAPPTIARLAGFPVA